MGLGPNPDAALVGTNCAHSRLMMKNYELDTTLHAEYRELKQVRDDLVTYNDLLKFWEHVRRRSLRSKTRPSLTLSRRASQVLASRRLFLPPNPPPPPPPPPAPGGPDGAPAPPAPVRFGIRTTSPMPFVTGARFAWQPMQVTFEEQTQQFVDQIAVLEAREQELVELVSHCTMGSRAAGTTCGLPPAESPDPWLAADGTPCNGYSTRSTREFDFCGYWCAASFELTRTPLSLWRLARVGPTIATPTRPTTSCAAR